MSERQTVTLLRCTGSRGRWLVRAAETEIAPSSGEVRCCPSRCGASCLWAARPGPHASRMESARSPHGGSEPEGDAVDLTEKFYLGIICRTVTLMLYVSFCILRANSITILIPTHNPTLSSVLRERLPGEQPWIYILKYCTTVCKGIFVCVSGLISGFIPLRNDLTPVQWFPHSQEMCSISRGRASHALGDYC